MRPLHILTFLLPLIVAYEVGSILYLVNPAEGVVRSVAAAKLFADFFKMFDLAGAFLPGLALAAVLLVWHVMARDRWEIHVKVLGGMFVESCMWALPLVVLAAASSHARASLAALAQAVAGVGIEADPQASLRSLNVGARLTIAVGAGLYEEMLFRLVGIAILHFLLVDVIGVGAKWGMWGAIGLAALAFALYHPHVLNVFVFTLLSGLYLGSVYSMRGFGIVVGAHTVYDILVLVIFSQ